MSSSIVIIDCHHCHHRHHQHHRHRDFKVRCVVRAHPPANVDWVKQGETIETGASHDDDDDETDDLMSHH